MSDTIHTLKQQVEELKAELKKEKVTNGHLQEMIYTCQRSAQQNALAVFDEQLQNAYKEIKLLKAERTKVSTEALSVVTDNPRPSDQP